MLTLFCIRHAGGFIELFGRCGNADSVRFDALFNQRLGRSLNIILKFSPAQHLLQLLG